MVKATVIGSGSWATALALVLADGGNAVTLWGRDPSNIRKIKHDKENKKYLPDVTLPDSIKFTDDLEMALFQVELVVFAVPSQTVRGVCRQVKSLIKGNTVIVNTAKGLELDSHCRISEVIKEEMGLYAKNICILSGPSHAEEVGKRLPTTIVSASEDKRIAEYVQDAFMTPYFRVYTNPDVIGVEMAGSLKNVIAVATGISDGLGFGDNSKAALITRGITEISRLGVKMGGNPSTFAGLSGIGDLIVTCTSMHSRNRRAGIELGQGKPLEQILIEMGMVVEGIKTTKAAFELAKIHQVEVPITEVLFNILFNNLEPSQGVNQLMERNKTHEVEEIVFNKKNW